MAAALEDVAIRPIPPKPSLYEAQRPAATPIPEPPKTFIPPAAEKTVSRVAPRMPHIDEFPIPAQNAIRARQAEAQGAASDADRPRMSLLARLASLGRREGEEAGAVERPMPRPQMPPLPERPRPIPRAPSDPVSEYAKRGVPQGLDQHGRPAPVHNQSEDDQLEIPAFLRRQAN